MLSAAPRLRRLSLRHLRVPTQHATPLPAAVWQLQHLTYLNLSKSQLTRSAGSAAHSAPMPTHAAAALGPASARMPTPSSLPPRLPACSFPEGPYTASLQELCADGCAPRSAALMQTLPAFPLLRHVIWADNSKLPLSAVRHLLAQAPGLKVRTLLLVGHAWQPAGRALQAATAPVPARRPPCSLPASLAGAGGA